MKCKEYKSMASAYIDRELDEGLATAYLEHVGTCSDCRVHLEEIQQVSLTLKRNETPHVPLELHSYVMNAARRERSGEYGLEQRAIDCLMKLNPRILSYTTGAVISTFLFVVTLGQFTSIHTIGQSTGKELGAFRVTSGSSLAMLYKLPAGTDDGSMVKFSNVAYQEPGDEAAVVLVQVTPDGRGTILEVMSRPRSPYLIEELERSLSNNMFGPALISGKPTTTTFVLLVEKVDIIG
jgi:hypothetical protein